MGELLEFFPRLLPPDKSKKPPKVRTLPPIDDFEEVPSTPIWFNGKDIVETAFCEEFMASHKLAYDNGAFFTPEG